MCQCRDEGGERALTVPEKKISSSERDSRVAGSHDQCRRAEDIDSSCWLFIIGHRLYVLQKAPMSILSCINPSVTDCCHSTFTGAEKSGALPACHQSINQGFASDWWYQMQCRWEMNKRTHSCRTNKPFVLLQKRRKNRSSQLRESHPLLHQTPTSGEPPRAAMHGGRRGRPCPQLIWQIVVDIMYCWHFKVKWCFPKFHDTLSQTNVDRSR